MNYQEAAKIRKSGFGELMTDRLTSGQGVFQSLKGTVSDKMKAKVKGIKQTFDPLNIAKKLTFGSKLGPAIVGKILGRNSDDVSFFTGIKGSLKKQADAGDSSAKLGEIYKLMVDIESKKRIDQELDRSFAQEKMEEDDRRNQEIIQALTARTPKQRKQNRIKEVEKQLKKKGKKEEPTLPSGGKPSTPSTGAPRPSASAASKPSTPAPSAPATPSVPTPPATASGGTSIIPKLAVGVAAAGATSMAIGGAESGGNYDITFGDRVDKKGNVVHGKNMSPEQRFGKKLTELTLEEVDTLGKERNKMSPSTSAMGKYQFMNTTLFGSKGKPGLVQQKGYDMKTTKFTPAIQDELYKLLHENDVATLKRLGVPITPGYEYMAHYLGAGGAKAVYDRRNSDMTVQQALIDAKLPDPVHGDTNKELSKLKASEFESTLESRLNKHGLAPHSTGTSGQKVDESSKQNNDMRKEMNKQQATPSITNNTMIQKTQVQAKQKVQEEDDKSPLIRKGQQ
jgi:hypothetical protein